jgi:hypothetical protein
MFDPNRRASPLVLASLGLALLAPLSAMAQDGPESNHIQGIRFDAHAVLGGYASLGAGLRLDIPLIGDGIIAGTDDELAISPGVDVFFEDFYARYYDGGPYLVPSCVLQWNFYIGPSWSVFPEAGVALYVGDREFLPRGRSVYAAPDVAFGARYHFNDRNALLARISFPTGFQLGLTF